MDDIRNDIRFLAHQLEDRLAQTEEEARAASYVRDRMAPFVATTTVEEFNSIGNERLLLAIFCAEFACVGWAAFWWPKTAFFYGLWVFMAHMAEAIGIPVYARFLPHYASAGVTGLCKLPQTVHTQIVFTAYLDSDDAPFPYLDVFLARLGIHRIIAAGMVIILAVCGVNGWSLSRGYANPVAHGLHITGIVFFSVLALGCLLRALMSNPSTGANRNASGVAALIYLAERLKKRPLKHAQVIFHFPGSHFANMGGMRHFLRTHPLSFKEDVYFFNMESVGGGQLGYTLSEGMLRRVACCPELIEIAASREARFKASAVMVAGFRTNIWLPLMRGFKAISIMGLGEDGLPAPYAAQDDTWDQVDAASVEHAARFTESIARKLATTHSDECALPWEL